MSPHTGDRARAIPGLKAGACARKKSGHPFWRVWHNMTPIPCPSCQSPLRLDRFDPV